MFNGDSSPKRRDVTYRHSFTTKKLASVIREYPLRSTDVTCEGKSLIKSIAESERVSVLLYGFAKSNAVIVGAFLVASTMSGRM